MAKKPSVVTTVSKTSTQVLPTPNADSVLPKTPQLTGEEMEQADFLAEIAKPSFQTASDGRRRYDQEWLGRNLFWRGYQFSRYLPQTQTIVLATRQSARVPVNLTAAYMRSIRNQVTSFRPKFEVLPTSPNNESANTQARYAQRLLDYYFDKLKLKMKIKETIIQALMYSIGGPWQVVYDEKSGEVRVWLLDPFDFYMDPLAEDPNEAEYMIKAVRRPLGEIVNNPEYNLLARKEITSGDSKLAASPQKQFMIQTTRIVPSRPGGNSPTLILYEGYFRRYRTTGEAYTVKCIWGEVNSVPLLYEEIDSDAFDFVVYRGDITPKEPYGESWIKHVMPINRVINTLESSALEYNTRVAKGRIVVDRDSGVRAIHNVHGEIISKNRGSQIQALDMPPLSISVPQQIERMISFSEDISGVHAATLGRLPTNVRTGIAIAELKQSDSSSQDDLVDNLEDFLTEVAMKILNKIAQNYTSYKVIKDLGIREGDQKYFAVVGKKYAKRKSGDELGHPGQVKIGPDWFDVAEIGDDNNIRVMVGSWLGYTKEALQQKVLNYYQIQLIDQSTALRLLEFGDVQSIIQQTRIEALLKKSLTTPSDPNQPDQLSLAMTENEMMLEGKEMPVQPNDDHMVHIAVHQEALGRGADDIVGNHIAKHQVYLSQDWGTTKPNEPSQPQQPSPPGPMAQAAPVTNAVNPLQPQQPQPPGPPPGQQLPQSNLEQVMGQNAANAAGAISPAMR